MFVHAFLGCDTTSAIYDIGKQCTLNLMFKSVKFQQNAPLVYNANSTMEEVIVSGEESIITLYKDSGQCLNSLRTGVSSKVGTSATFVDKKYFLSHHQLPNITARECTYKLRNGLELDS